MSKDWNSAWGLMLGSMGACGITVYWEIGGITGS